MDLDWAPDRSMLGGSKPMKEPRYGILAGATLVGVLWASHASAQSDPVAARVLFSDARALAAQGKYEQACPKFDESQRLDPGIGTLFNLADCWEHMGRTASAWGRFLDVAAQAKLAGQPDREKVARDRAAILEPKLSRLTIDVASKDQGLEVRRDDVQIGAAILGSAMPVDPGSHTVEAKAPNKKPWRQTIEVGTSAAKVTITVPALEEDCSSASGPATPAPTPPAAIPVGASTGAEMSGSGGGSHTLAYLLLGAAAVGTGVGTVFGLQAKSKNDTALGDRQIVRTTASKTRLPRTTPR